MCAFLRESRLLVLVFVAFALLSGTGRGDSLELVRDGVPKATIVMAKEPTLAAQLAAAELNYHIEKITGAVLPIVDDAQAVAGNRVLVGASLATESLGVRGSDFAPQEYLIRFQPGVLLLAGCDKPDLRKLDYRNVATFPGLFDPQGTCYAAYDFLERCAGVRWYLPTELGLCVIPAKTLVVSGAEVRRRPAMKHRGGGGLGYRIPADLCGDTVAGPKAPPTLDPREDLIYWLRHRLGGTPYQANHSLYGYYDRFWRKKSPHFEEFHPEYFAQGYEGEPPQMCYTNPGLIDRVAQEARDYFDGKGLRQGAQAAGDFFAVVPMDNSSYCKCPACEKFSKKIERGVDYFSNDQVSDYVFAFVNEIAKKVKQDHPDKYIASLAYARYAYPPKTFKLEPNVSVQLCLHARNVYSPGMQANDRAMLDAWVAESPDRPKLLWLYYCFPSLIPATSSNSRCFPGFFAHSIVEQMRRYHEAGIVGLRYEPSYLAHYQRSPLLDQVEFYVTWKLADDPALDGNALIDEFFDRYYGAAAAPMKAFYEQVERTYSDPANYPAEFAVKHSHLTEKICWETLGTEARMQALGLLMDQARAAATTELEKQRVALFDKGIWQYMQAGRKAYLEKTAAK